MKVLRRRGSGKERVGDEGGLKEGKMKPISKLACAISATALVTACTNVTVREVDSSLQVSHVCIKDNPAVIVAEFIPVVRQGFQRHGITTEVYEEQKPRHCEYHLTYTALKTWDVGMYMHHAELQLYRGVEPIGYAEYHLDGKGGLDLSKWASVDSKMDPVIDELLAGFTPGMVDAYRKPIPDSFDTPETEENSKYKNLRELKDWFNEGLITEEEYNSEKEKILSQ